MTRFHGYAAIVISFGALCQFADAASGAMLPPYREPTIFQCEGDLPIEEPFRAVDKCARSNLESMVASDRPIARYSADAGRYFRTGLDILRRKGLATKEDVTGPESFEVRMFYAHLGEWAAIQLAQAGTDGHKPLTYKDAGFFTPVQFGNEVHHLKNGSDLIMVDTLFGGSSERYVVGLLRDSVLQTVTMEEFYDGRLHTGPATVANARFDPKTEIMTTYDNNGIYFSRVQKFQLVGSVLKLINATDVTYVSDGKNSVVPSKQVVIYKAKPNAQTH